MKPNKKQIKDFHLSCGHLIEDVLTTELNSLIVTAEHGYSGFYLEYEFNKDDELITSGIWE